MGDDRIHYSRRRRWTNYITTDPVRLVQNLLGGGDVQRDRLVIADLELQQADLVRRRWEVSEAIAQTIIDEVLNWERLDRQLELLDSQMLTQQQQQAVMEASYRTGSGSTATMLTVWQRAEELEARLIETQIDQTQTRQGLERLVFGFETVGNSD